MSYRVGVGAASIELSDEISAAVDSALERMAPTVKKRITSEIERLGTGAAKAWPVGPEHTGKRAGQPHSRDLFVRGLRLPDLDTVEGYIANTAPYVYLIRARKLGGQSPFVQLVRKPMERAANLIAEDLAEDLADLLGD